MNTKTRSILSSNIVIGLVLGFLLALPGCSKEQPVTQQSSSEQVAAKAKETQPAQTSDVATVAVEQTTCPVMEGSPINKALFVEYKGKKVYFCCQGCSDRFLADPAQYVAKLPQFKE
jgi:YHS domain-containing protein